VGDYRLGRTQPVTGEQGSEYAPLFGNGTGDPCGFIARALSSGVRGILKFGTVARPQSGTAPVTRVCLAVVRSALAVVVQHQEAVPASGSGCAPINGLGGWARSISRCLFRRSRSFTP
jgi:hypothetical protein